MRVLLIEDNPGDARLVQEMLKESSGDFTIHAEDRLGRGLQYLASHEVDLVLTDLGLPDSRGLETLIVLQARHHLPIVIITSTDDERLGMEAVRRGAQDYLVKGRVNGELLRRAFMYAVERKKAEEKLRESQKRNDFLANLIHSSSQPLGVGYLDGRIKLVNRAFEELTGYSADELLSIDWAVALTPPEWREHEREKLAELHRTGRPIRYEKEYIRKDGARVPTELLVHLMTDSEGKPQHYYAFVTDITGRKKAEAELLKLTEELAGRNTELEHLNRELEAFNYSVSHDLRAPLRTMAGFSKMIVENYGNKLDDQCRDYLNRITNASDRMTRLINDLLHLSKISRQELDRMDIDLSNLAASTATSLRAASPGSAVEVVIQPGVRAFADLNLMRVVMTNLFDNAWKFTSKTENARVEFGGIERETRDTRLETVYYVKDNGTGFDTRYAEKMFWPFQRLHSEKEFAGTGIGLAIVERIIRRHGGKVWAEGEVGKGAAVFFTLG